MNIDDILQLKQFQGLGEYLASEMDRTGGVDINDFLKRKQFQHLDGYLTSEMERTAGEDFFSQMNGVFQTLEKAKDYYFSHNRALGGERPYDLCKRGKVGLAKDELTRLDHGMYS